jgi:hypothetical protein
LKKIFLVIIFAFTLTGTVFAQSVPSGGGGESKVGTVTNGKWCVGDAGGLVQCTEDAPAGAGDITSIGDAGNACDAGDCTYFYLGGVRLGDSSPDADGEFGFASNEFLFYGGALVPATNNYALGSATKRWTGLFLNDGATINFNNGDVVWTHAANTLTLSGGNLALGANSLTLTGSIGATGAGKATKVWTIDLETTNAPTVNGTAANATGGLITNPMTAAGDLITGGASGVATGKIAGVAAGQPLLSGGVATASAYAGYTFSGTAAQTYTFPSASATLAKVDAPVFTTSIEAPFLILGSAATAADAGTIRMPNAANILFEADGAGTDINALEVDSSEVVQIGKAGASGVTITPATTITGLLTANGGITVPNGKLVDLSGITMDGTNDEGFTLPFWADITPTSGATKRFFTWDEAGGVLKVYTAGGWVTINPSAGAPTDVAYLTTGSLSGSLSAERLLAEGLAIDFSDAGANGNFTIAFDPTELTGNRTWAAGGAASVTWTWDNSGTTDPALVFGDGVITTNSKLSPTTDDGAALGDTTHNWSDLFLASGSVINWANSDVTLTHGANTVTLAGGDLALGANNLTMTGSIAATGNRVTKGWFTSVESTNAPSVNGVAANATNGLVTNPMTAVGDIIIGAASGASTGKLVDVAAGQPLLSGGVGAAPAYAGYTFSGTAAQTYTFPSATDTLAGVAATNTFTANNTFGNADTDTLTLRSLLVGGNSRAVWIAGSAPTPTYATGTNELYVAGDIETAGTIYAAGANFGTGADGSRAATFVSNTALTCSGDQLYVLNDVFKVCENGTSRDIVTPADAVTWTGATHDFSAVTNLRLPTAAADSSGEIYIPGSGRIFGWHDGTGLVKINTTNIADGKILKWVAANGAFEIADDATAGSPTLDSVGDPVGDSTIVMDATEEVTFQYTGAFTTGSQFLILQDTGNPSGGVLFEVRTTDTDVTNSRFGDGTNYVQIGPGGNMTLAGTAIITAGGIVLGDSSPDADGEIGYASNHFNWFANSEDLVLTFGSNLATFSSNTSATIAFTPAVAFSSTATVGGAIITGGTNTFNVTNGTASLDVAAGAAVNIDTGLTVQTGAVTLTGNVAGSTLVLPSGSLTLGTMAAETATNYVAKSLYDAYSVLYADTDNTPAALTVGANTLVGRIGAGIVAVAIDSDLSSVSANDDTVPSAKATKAMGDLKLTIAVPATIDGSAGTGPTAAQMQDPRCRVSNYGQAASDVAVALPAPADNLSCLFVVETAQSNKWGVQAAANDKIYLIAADGTIAAGSDNGYARMTAAQVGQSFACWSMKTGASAWDWSCKGVAIGTSTFAAN